MTGEFSKVSFLESFNKNCLKVSKDRFVPSQVFRHVFVLQKNPAETRNNHLKMESEENFEDARICWFCDDPINAEEDGIYYKRGYHCHFTGKYQGSAHTHCKFKKKQNFSSSVPIAMHNMTIYCSHLFVKSLLFQKQSSVPNKMNQIT